MNINKNFAVIGHDCICFSMTRNHLTDFLHVILFLIVGQSFYCTAAVVQSLSNQNFLSVPNNIIWTNVTNLDLSLNTIQAVNGTEDFLGCSKLTYLIMTKNNLTAFPHLPNIANTLTTIKVDYNRINYVEPRYLANLTKLQYLYMGNNQITSFPDVYMPSLIYLGLKYNLLPVFPYLPIIGKKLRSFYISGNKFNSIPMSSLLVFGKLIAIGLDSLNMQTLPNWCSLPQNENVALWLSFNSWYCDCRLRWLQTATNFNYSFSPPICSGPSHVAGLPLANLTNLPSCSG